MGQTITFNEVAIRGSKTIECEGGCGRKLRRSRQFWQTLSPFNKNAVGELKTRDEIQTELFAERSAWMAQPETCSHCTK